MNNAVIAPHLPPGGMVGVVSPSSPPRDDALILRGVSAILAEGHYPRLGLSVGAADGYLAGPDAVRSNDLMEMFADERIRAIFCTRGGYGSARLLDLLDYRFIQSHPKILVGFSDITALSLALYTKARLITFAGPMIAAEFASGIRPLASEALWDMLRQRKKTRRLPHCESTRILQGGVAEGTLLGGNLSVLCSLIGTPWLPDMRGAVLFVEEVGESVYRVDRMLLQLRQSGILRRISGVILGSFTAVPVEKQNRELDEVLKEYLLPLGIPVLGDFPFGHIPEKITLPFGSQVRLDANRKSVTVLQPVVS